MKYDHAVKYDGTFYPAGSDVPVETKDFEIKQDTNVKNEESYTKTDIKKMPIAELKDLAISIGITDAENKTDSELKKSLIEFYGL